MRTTDTACLGGGAASFFGTRVVHVFMLALARQAKALGWETFQFDPPHLASRHLRHFGSLRYVHTDGFGILRGGGVVRPFFLE